jgi:hypothetical protein
MCFLCFFVSGFYLVFQQPVKKVVCLAGEHEGHCLHYCSELIFFQLSFNCAVSEWS